MPLFQNFSSSKAQLCESKVSSRHSPPLSTILSLCSAFRISQQLHGLSIVHTCHSTLIHFICHHVQLLKPQDATSIAVHFHTSITISEWPLHIMPSLSSVLFPNISDPLDHTSQSRNNTVHLSNSRTVIKSWWKFWKHWHTKWSINISGP